MPPEQVGTYNACGDGMTCVNKMCVVGTPDAQVGDAAADASPDAPHSGRCDPAKPFGTPTIVPNVNTGFRELSFSLSSDELSAYIVRDNTVTTSMTIGKRASITDDFPVDEADPSIANVSSGFDPLSAKQDHRLFLRGIGGAVFESSRNALTDAFPTSTKLMVDSGSLSGDVSIVGANPDALRFYWSDSAGLHMAENQNQPYEYVNTTTVSSFPVGGVMTADELTIYYSSVDGIQISTRPNLTALFDPGPLIASTIGSDTPLSVTSDQCFLYLLRYDNNDPNIYVATRPH